MLHPRSIKHKKGQNIYFWISQHTVHIQAMLVIFALVISVICGFSQKYDELIITLLVLLCSEFFVLTIGYLEPIKEKTAGINKGNRTIEVIDRSEFPLKAHIKSAKHDVFISGTVLNSIFNDCDMFENWDKTKSLHLLSMNLDDEKIVNAFSNIYEKKLKKDTLIKQKGLFLEFLNKFHPKDEKEDDGNQNDKIVYKVSNRAMPYVFIGIDIDTPSANTLIKVQHYLCEKIPQKLTFTYVLKPDSDLFDVFKEQINILWNEAIPVERHKEQA